MSVEEAAMQSMGMMPPAHSVAIAFKPLNEVQVEQVERRRNQGQAKATADPTAAFNETQKTVVERIRRRKLVSALKVTFIEPEVEKRAVSPTETKVMAKTEQPPADPTGQAAKRNRIDAAKRYLF